MATATINGIPIGFDDEGSGDPLVLIHGHPFDRSMWGPQRTAFAREGYRVITPDLRGFGANARAPEAADFSAYAHDIAALLDHLGLQRVVIGGLSMGGQVVMDFCRLHPERIRGVLLADTFPKAETDAGKRWRNEVADRLLREGMAGWSDEVLDKMVAPHNIDALPEVAAHVRTMMHGAPRAGAAVAHRVRAQRVDFQDTLRQLAVPALVVVGSDDAYTSVADAEHMHALIPDSTLCVIEGAAHMPNLERAAEFNAGLRRFLARVSMPPTNGYRHAVRATGELVSVAGQIAMDAAGAIVGEGDAEAQTRQVFRNLDRALRAEDATLADVVKLNFYLADVADLPTVRKVRDDWINTEAPPTSSAVQVAAFIRPELLIEIDALAVVNPAIDR